MSLPSFERRRTAAGDRWMTRGSHRCIESKTKTCSSEPTSQNRPSRLRLGMAPSFAHRVRAWLARYYNFRSTQLWSTSDRAELVKTSTGNHAKAETVWHGTGTFPAHMIWRDKKDG
jgi:hypothetical protein